MQLSAQLLDLAAWTVGEHPDRAHLITTSPAGGCCGNFDPTPGEADVNAASPASLIRGYAQNL